MLGLVCWSQLRHSAGYSQAKIVLKCINESTSNYLPGLGRPMASARTLPPAWQPGPVAPRQLQVGRLAKSLAKSPDSPGKTPGRGENIENM